MQEFKVKETKVKQFLGFKAESINSKSEFEKEIKALKSANDSFKAQLKKMKAQEIETEKSSQLEITELKSKVKNLEKAIIY